MFDGPVRMASLPRLTTAQYGELLGIVQRLSTEGTGRDLIKDVREAAERWGVTAVFSCERD